MVIFWGFIILTGLLYLLLVSFIICGWVRTGSYRLQDGIEKPHVSVIIPFRDEKEGLNLLLSDLAVQNYPEAKFEILLVDDHSYNPGTDILPGLKSKVKLRRLSLDINEQGKKAALIKGVNASDSELILTTDADCRVTPSWISEMSGCFVMNKAKLVFGSVLYQDSKKLNEWLQGLEYMGLTAAGAGFAGNGHPVICSGANMGFGRTVYLEYATETGNSFPVSGDDVMFLLWMKKKYPCQAVFIKTRDSVVMTKPAEGIREFISQRLRWTSKSRYYRDTAIILTGLTVYLESLALLVLFAGSFFGGFILKGFIIMFLLKCAADLVLLYIVTGYYRKRHLLKIFLPLELIYFVYISIIGAAGNIIPFKWKGRKLGPGGKA